MPARRDRKTPVVSEVRSVERLGQLKAANHLGNLDIEQMRRMKTLGCAEQPSFDRGTRRRTQEDFAQRGSVDGGHLLSRSARTARIRIIADMQKTLVACATSCQRVMRFGSCPMASRFVGEKAFAIACRHGSQSWATCSVGSSVATVCSGTMKLKTCSTL